MSQTGGGGLKGGPSSGGGGGGGARGRHRNDFFPLHLLCTIKSQIGDQWGGGHCVNGGGGHGPHRRAPPPIVTPWLVVDQLLTFSDVMV